ncbi:MAG: Bug family tripartite tricarboxylate transporter substrate binding protein [Burkholderiales bacterium]
MKRILLGMVALMAAAGVQAQGWKPTKPVTIIVPWAAGGSTDQVTRLTAAELEKHLGQKVVIVNQPGASGSIGTKSAWEAPKDGYTWTAGAAQDLGVYRALGMLETNLSDWHLYLSVANVPVVGVNPGTPYKSMKDLLDAMKAKPGEVTVATAGVTSGGHNAMEAIARATGVKYRHVTYDGGNPAVIATVSGETQVTTQLAVEQAEMIRGKRLRPLAAVSDKALEIEGYGSIEPITRTVRMSIPTNYFGVFVPKGVPQEVVSAMDKLWREQIARSAALRKYATSRGALFAPVAGQEAQKAAMPAVQANAWLLHAGGKTKVSPDSVGIPKP